MVAPPPVLAADAASEPEDVSASPTGVLGTHHPDFPRHGRSSDWCAWASQQDAELARQVSALFPWSPDLFTDAEAARMYYKRRYTGVLTPVTVALLVRFYDDCYIPPENQPRSLHQLLAKDKLQMVLGACRASVHQAIREIEENGETDDGPARVLGRLMEMHRQITPETDLLDFMSFSYDKVAPLFVGHEVGAKNILPAAQAYREAVVEEIKKWPYWLVVRPNFSEYPQILGMSIEEVRGFHHRFAKEKECSISELKKFLST